MNDIVQEFTTPVVPLRRFPLIGFDQIQLSTAPSYLVKGLIPRSGLVVIWGPPKCGKSFWAFDVAAHIALGWSYRDRKVQQGTVVYLVLEGEHGIGARVEAFRHHHLGEDAESVPLYLLPTRLDLIHEYQTLIDEIAAQTTNNPPALIVIDTLNRSLSGSESRDEDMGAYIKAADAVREAFKATVMVIHHCGIEATRPRGHTSLTGAADAQIAVKRDTAGVICATLEWLKDGPEGAEVFSKLEPVDVGTDNDGDPITSCIIVEAEGSEHETGKQSKLSPRMRRGLDVLNNCIIENGEPAPGTKHYPDGARVVSLNLWREALFSSGVLDRNAANPRADFKRLKDGLADRGAAREWNGLIWPV